MRRCLLKGCEQRYHPRQARQRYCSESCREAARKWSRWKAQQRYRCPAYLRGEAYLTLHDGKAAAAEFQKFIDHRGVVMNFPWGALAPLGLARAYAMQGDTAKAKIAYQDFLTLWKDADPDPDIPILKEAKAEYAKLQ